MGEEENSFVGKTHKIDFFSLQTLRFTGKPTLPGTRKISYHFQANLGVLERGEEPLLSQPKRTQFLTLSEGFREFDFRFLGKKGWVRIWEAKEWPLGIQISGVFVTSHGKEIDFEKTFFPLSS